MEIKKKNAFLFTIEVKILNMIKLFTGIICRDYYFQMTEVKAAQYESEKNFRSKLSEMTKTNGKAVETLQVTLVIFMH